jgi:hypothetical protein
MPKNKPKIQIRLANGGIADLRAATRRAADERAALAPGERRRQDRRLGEPKRQCIRCKGTFPYGQFFHSWGKETNGGYATTLCKRCYRVVRSRRANRTQSGMRTTLNIGLPCTDERYDRFLESRGYVLEQSRLGNSRLRRINRDGPKRRRRS